VLALLELEAGDFEVWDFAAVLLVLLPVLDPAVDACPRAHNGDAHAHITAKAQLAPSHLVILVRYFPSGFKNNLKTSVANDKR
jgi:hypothetical protein